MATTTTEVWDAARVRRELPVLAIIGHDSKNYKGRIVGRNSDEATIVLCDETGQHVNHPITGDYVSVPFAWASIAFTLNSGKPITFRP
jgi:hypothetical protein